MSLERLYLVWDAVSVPWMVTLGHFLWQGLLLALLLGTAAWMLAVRRPRFVMPCCSADWR